jgi:ubiquinone/menaquinone biosynthesis C-methylase UbiE
MGFYTERILPRLIDVAMRYEDLAPYRRRVAAGAWGQVLEVGIGSGLNLPWYDRAAVKEIVGLDPSPRLIEMARRRAEALGVPLTLVEGSAEAIAVGDASIDAVVMTWTLCSIVDPPQALAEIRRILRPGGELLFVEHGMAPDKGVAAWQNRLTPVWKHVAGGCHLNRDMARLVEDAGFTTTALRRGYMPGAPRPFAFMYEGRARPG